MVMLRQGIFLLHLLILLGGVESQFSSDPPKSELVTEQCVDDAKKEMQEVVNEEQGHATCKVDADGNCLDWACEDKYPKCDQWASAGECEQNGKFMLNFCKKSCDICDFTGNLTELIKLKKRLHEVGGDETLLETDYGMTQLVNVGEQQSQVEQVVADMEKYMKEVVWGDPKFESVKHTCKNRDKSCAYWAAIGECDKNPEYMTKLCAPSCQTCVALDYNTKCPVDKSLPVAFEPGHVNTVFERIVTSPKFQKYTPRILSMPNSTVAGVVEGPWVLELEHFMSKEEASRLIDLGHELGYKRSGDTGKKNFDGTYDKSINSGRTSTNAFCQFQCLTDPVTQNVTKRIEELTGVPQINYEFLQLLRYEPGQFYNTHHDYAQYHTERQFGARVLTVFLYLNEVEAGGGTDFPNLGFTVKPKVGKVIIWPSVQSDAPEVIDIRTRHGALPVEKGIKYGANAWIHTGNFKDTYAKGCI